MATSQPKKVTQAQMGTVRAYVLELPMVYKLLDDGRWFIVYQDDASRFLVGYGVFAKGHHKARNRRTARCDIKVRHSCLSTY